MLKITIYTESDINVDVDNMLNYLNKKCNFIKFKKGKTEFKIKEEVIHHPSTYIDIDNNILTESKGDILTILLTLKPYDNNFFYKTYGHLAILSFYGWNYLTRLSMNNGLVYFIFQFLALDIDDSYRHENTSGCLYDFNVYKTGIDVGMRFSGICPNCLTKISNLKLNEGQKQLLYDLRTIMTDLGAASKWNQDIIAYWDNEGKIKTEKIIIEDEYLKMKQNDFIPINNDKNYIDINRKNISELCKLYTDLEKKLELTNEKGKLFELFSEKIFTLIKGWKIIGKDSRLEDCEIDLIMDITEGPEVLRAKVGGTNIYIECKNRKEKSDVKDISHFIVNLESRNLKTGIFFSYSGISGYDPNDWMEIKDAYRRIIDIYRQKQIRVIPFVFQDIEAIKNGVNIVDHLQELLNLFVRV
jgi:hypothetical protein